MHKADSTTGSGDSDGGLKYGGTNEEINDTKDVVSGSVTLKGDGEVYEGDGKQGTGWEVKGESLYEIKITIRIE